MSKKTHFIKNINNQLCTNQFFLVFWIIILINYNKYFFYFKKKTKNIFFIKKCLFKFINYSHKFSRLIKNIEFLIFWYLIIF